MVFNDLEPGLLHGFLAATAVASDLPRIQRRCTTHRDWQTAYTLRGALWRSFLVF